MIFEIFMKYILKIYFIILMNKRYYSSLRFKDFTISKVMSYLSKYIVLLIRFFATC